MKKERLKMITIILAIVLISAVSFIGVYTQVQNRMENKLKPFEYTMDIKGERQVSFIPSEATKSVVKDSSGNTVKDADDMTEEEIEENGYTQEDVAVNSSDSLTKENYEASKKSIEDKLKRLQIQEYHIRLDQNTGTIVVELPEGQYTDETITALLGVNKFQIVDEQTEEELMNNDDIDYVSVQYGQTSEESTGTSVFMAIQFDKEGTKKLEEITKTYKKETDNTQDNTDEENSTEESSENTEKNVVLRIDDEDIMTTNFEQEITNGVLSLSLGKETTDQEEFQENLSKANEMKLKLESKTMPITYTVSENKYILSEITRQYIDYIKVAVIILVAIALIVLIIKHKIQGLLASIAYIGFGALLLLVLRYTNTIVSLEGIFAILLVLALDYMVTWKALNVSKEKLLNTYKDFFIKLIPIIIMGLVFNFIKWNQFISFGNVIFWGTVLLIIYNELVTSTLLKLKVGGANNEK